jgi:hypothetical protein
MLTIKITREYVPVVCLELQLELVELLVQLPQVPVHQPNDRYRCRVQRG